MACIFRTTKSSGMQCTYFKCLINAYWKSSSSRVRNQYYYLPCPLEKGSMARKAGDSCLWRGVAKNCQKCATKYKEPIRANGDIWRFLNKKSWNVGVLFGDTASGAKVPSLLRTTAFYFLQFTTTAELPDVDKKKSMIFVYSTKEGPRWFWKILNIFA